MVFRIQPIRAGSHVRVRFWSAPVASGTFAGLGELVMLPAEWDIWRAFYRAVATARFDEHADGTIEIEMPATMVNA